MRKWIYVTAKDIASGKPGRVCSCPIALAAARAFGTMTASVGCGVLCLPTYTHSLDLPPRANEFVRHFDLTCKGTPFRFQVGVPS